jgi:hypothetical protein
MEGKHDNRFTIGVLVQNIDTCISFPTTAHKVDLCFAERLLPCTMQHFGKGALRVAKNYTKGYSEAQAKVRDATSNDPWGPSGTQMNELAQMTYHQ